MVIDNAVTLVIVLRIHLNDHCSDILKFTLEVSFIPPKCYFLMYRLSVCDIAGKSETFEQNGIRVPSLSWQLCKLQPLCLGNPRTVAQFLVSEFAFYSVVVQLYVYYYGRHA